MQPAIRYYVTWSICIVFIPSPLVHRILQCTIYTQICALSLLVYCRVGQFLWFQCSPLYVFIAVPICKPVTQQINQLSSLDMQYWNQIYWHTLTWSNLSNCSHSSNSSNYCLPPPLLLLVVHTIDHWDNWVMVQSNYATFDLLEVTYYINNSCMRLTLSEQLEPVLLFLKH